MGVLKSKLSFSSYSVVMIKGLKFRIFNPKEFSNGFQDFGPCGC